MPWPDHLLSLEEWDALPEDNTRHYELVQGVLQVSPRPILNHQRAISRLSHQLDDQLPVDIVVLDEVEVVIRQGRRPTVRVPDLVVVSHDLLEADLARCQADDVKLAIEVISPGTEDIDRGHKAFEYSAVRIPNYWILDIRPPVTLTAYQLVDLDYEIVGEGTDKLTLSSPAPVTIDVAGLLPHRA